MKKFLIVMAGILVMSMYSCSDEQATEQTQTETKLKSGSPTTVSLYNAMINSQKYKQADAARKSFLSKMNFTGSVTLVDTEQKMLQWINANIATTSYVNYNAAVSELSYVKQLDRAVFAEHQGFFDSLMREGNPQLVYYDLVNPQQEPLEQDPCGCEQTFISTVNAAASTFASAATSALNSGSGVYNSYTAAQSSFQLSLAFAEHQLVICTINCV